MGIDVRSLWSELRRRKVVRLTIIYVVVGWVVIEAADVIFPALAIPDWAISLVVAIVLLGLPIALVVSWMFDVGPEGVRRTAAEPGAATPPSGSAARPAGRASGAASDAQAAHAATGTTSRPEASAGGTAAGGGAAATAGGPDAPPAADRSIAVLPFVNMSDDKDNEYFSDGMTEEILNALAKVKHLRVASRTSSFQFKGEESDVLQIARKLRVESVVEGSVRKAGNRIRVTAQLISAADGYHLWSESYDRELEDVFQVQDDIARSIVDALKVELGADEEEQLVEPETKDVEAYTLYLKGRFLFNRYQESDLKRSLELYHEALELDPSYARAWAGISDVWMQLADDWAPPEEAYPKARQAAERAIELNPGLAEAHTAIGKVLGWFEWDFDGAELALRRAVAANRQYGDAHWGLGTILPATGLLDEAIEEMRLAVGIDPVSPVFSYFLARFLYFRGELEEAMDEARRSIELDPSTFRARLVVGLCHLLRDQPEEALGAFEEAFEVSGVESAHTFCARAHAAAGREGRAREILDELEAGDAYIRSEFTAAAWAALDDLDRAFTALDQAYDDRSAGLIYLHVDPGYEPLRGDPRYAALVEKIGVRGPERP